MAFTPKKIMHSDSQDENVLYEYGTKDDSGKWTFDLFRNIGDIAGQATMLKFKNDEFEINFNGYKVYGSKNKNDLIKSETSGGNSGD